MHDVFIKNIEITLDDFGISELANDRIIALIKSGNISRVSVMMNGILRQNDITELLHSGVLLDIHLDRYARVETERSLTAGAVKRLLLFVKQYLGGELSPRIIEKRWEQQLQSFHEIFRRFPDGINSHEHVHFFPPYLRIAIWLAQKYDIQYMRFGQRTVSRRAFIAWILHGLQYSGRHIFRKSGLLSPAILISWDWLKQDTVPQWSTLTKPFFITEIIFHPERKEEYILLQQALGILPMVDEKGAKYE
ncbi:MAG: ChbG/HpnK family deacetylase [Minisyncoccota bacterium]